MLNVYMPATAGEFLAFGSAGVTALIGALHYFFPRAALRLHRLQKRPDAPDALAEVRGPMAGFHLGTGLLCMLMAQPFLYMALGVSWALAVFGRLTSMLFDRGNTPINWVFALIEAALALAPLALVFGYIA